MAARWQQWVAFGTATFGRTTISVEEYFQLVARKLQIRIVDEEDCLLDYI